MTSAQERLTRRVADGGENEKEESGCVVLRTGTKVTPQQVIISFLLILQIKCPMCKVYLSSFLLKIKKEEAPQQRLSQAR